MQAIQTMVDSTIQEKCFIFLGLSKIRLRMVLSLITGHCRLNGHLSKMRLHPYPMCGGCLLEEETANHFICTCPSLAQKRQKVFGKPILDKAKISELSASDILKFAMLSKRFSTDPLNNLSTCIKYFYQTGMHNRPNRGSRAGAYAPPTKINQSECFKVSLF
jgi:hypothetical protein